MLCTAFAFACPSAASATDTGGTAYGADSAGASRHALLGARVSFRGEARRGTRVAVQRLDEGAWVTVARAVAGRSNHYVARWRTDHIGVFEMRTVPLSNAASVGASSVDEPEQLVVYRQAGATWFGRGLYGRKTACGQTLSAKLMGVAHRTLPCGTKVAFLYKGRTITVPVVDRGPFGAGLSWDLTTAAADALGFLKAGRVTLGAVSLRRN